MDTSALWDRFHLLLKDDPTSRSRAVATRAFHRGDTIARITALSTALLPAEKGVRCDYCHRKTPRLLRCSKCASSWYCGPKCQTRSWQAYHRYMCKRHASWLASTDYQRLHEYDRMEVTLLSQIACEAATTPALTDGDSSPIVIMMSLLPSGKPWPSFSLLIPPDKKQASLDVEAIYSRFSNNNFVLHSHLTSFAHGVYPVASRLFNHSCQANAAIKYILAEGEPPFMEVVALRNIRVNEEVSIPYIDPALPITDRERALSASYNFQCVCHLCIFQRTTSTSPLENSDSSRTSLLRFTGCELSHPPPDHDLPRDLEVVPLPLLPYFHSSALPAIAEIFSESSHSGATTRALEFGQTLLAIYFLVYPPNYPQIGMHALEVAKTAWNGLISGGRDWPAEEYLSAAEWYLTIAERTARILGPEGDDDGPLQEIAALRDLIGEERSIVSSKLPP